MNSVLWMCRVRVLLFPNSGVFEWTLDPAMCMMLQQRPLLISCGGFLLESEKLLAMQ
jgi:hypothetical protein